jgi:hypothetical protein
MHGQTEVDAAMKSASLLVLNLREAGVYAYR